MLIIVLLYGLIYGTYLSYTLPDVDSITFYTNHGFLFSIGLIFFPRITMLISAIWFNMATFGFFWWLGWEITPRFVIAGMASAYYWDTNGFLVFIAWTLAVLSSFDDD